MRTEQDLVKVKWVASGVVELDLERVEQDPVWINELSVRYDIADPVQRDQALTIYVARYMGQEFIFKETPSTFGPSEVFPTFVEVIPSGGTQDGR